MFPLHMDMLSIRSMFNSCLSCQSAEPGGGAGLLPFHSQSIPKCYQKMIFGVLPISVNNNIPVTCSKFPFPFPFPIGCSIHSSSSHHQSISCKSAHYYHSQFYQEELGSKNIQGKNFLPTHLSETPQELGGEDQVLHRNSFTQPNDILDESHRGYDFLHKPQFDNSSNADKLGLEMERRDRNRRPISEEGGKEEERKPMSEAGNLMSSRIQEEEEEEDSLGLEMERRDKRRRRRQMMKRSTMIAKQVISIQSALTLGFVSQLWVDPTSWTVLIVEVRPNLLSGELEKFFLEDIAKVGDVVLIEDESVMENDFKLLGLETLVGYTVVTPGQRSIGKVRGYTFDINSGAVESLELDSFGISIIPSSLVSTYGLFVEDVVEVLAETVVVHEAAASRIQRLTKGFWGASKKKKKKQKIGEMYKNTGDEVEERVDDYWERRKRELSSRKKFGWRGEKVEEGIEWEVPMDYT